jgi:hypothetical protein
MNAINFLQPTDMRICNFENLGNSGRNAKDPEHEVQERRNRRVLISYMSYMM